jgi:hypothetical protein
MLSWVACWLEDFGRKRERERERERERLRASSSWGRHALVVIHTERQSDRQTDRDRDRERERECVCEREREREREIVAHTFAHPAQRTQTVAAVVAAARLFCCSSPVLYARMFLYLHILGKKKMHTSVVSTRTRALY